MDRQTLLDLIPAYALGALDPNERAEVEALLATDAEARQELAIYQDISDNLVLATPARRAPAHLQNDLRQRLAAQKSSNAASTPPPPAPNHNQSSGDGVELPTLQVVRRKRFDFVPLLAAAAAFVIILGGLLLFTRPQATTDPGQALFDDIISRGGSRVPITAVDSSATGEMVMSTDGSQAVIQVASLPNIETNQIFQLWLIDANGAHSGGLLTQIDVSKTNYIIVPLEKPVTQYDAFGVSIEPETGSPNPDGPSGPRVFGITI